MKDKEKARIYNFISKYLKSHKYINKRDLLNAIEDFLRFEVNTKEKDIKPS